MKVFSLERWGLRVHAETAVLTCQAGHSWHYVKQAKHYLGRLTLLTVLIVSVQIANANDVTEGSLRDALLGRSPGTPSFDLNGDGHLDVADLVLFAKMPPLVSFALASSQVLEGQNTATVQLNFNKSFSGFVSYSLAGTAVAGPGEDYKLPSGFVSVNGTNASISIQIYDDLIAKAPRTIILTLIPDTANPPRYQPGSTSSHTMVLEDNDAHWEGLMTLGGLSFSLQMDIAQQGTNYQATIAGGTGFFPTGAWPVTTSITSNSFTGVVGPIQYPASASSLGMPFTRYLNLSAYPGINSGDVFTNGVVISGLVTETLTYTNMSWNKTSTGSFTLRRTDATAPTTTVPLTTITP